MLFTVGWVGEVEVEAHVVTIRNAAAADDSGLLNPLLKRWKDGTCSQMVFGLPAVRAVINFKWDRWILCSHCCELVGPAFRQMPVNTAHSRVFSTKVRHDKGASGDVCAFTVRRCCAAADCYQSLKAYALRYIGHCTAMNPVTGPDTA